MSFVYVFIGGGIGSILRYAISLLLDKASLHFPIATLTANALACLLLGFAAGYMLKEGIADHYKLLLLTGVCGGFSTFSTFTNETFKLFQEGQMLYAFSNILISVAICLGFLLIGYKWSGQ